MTSNPSAGRYRRVGGSMEVNKVAVEVNSVSGTMSLLVPGGWSIKGQMFFSWPNSKTIVFNAWVRSAIGGRRRPSQKNIK